MGRIEGVKVSKFKPTKEYKSMMEVRNQREANDVLQAKDAIVVVNRDRPRWLKLRCPDGCGELLSINLDPLAGRSWKLLVRTGKVSLFPSVWRDTGCESHFILWNNRVFFCYGMIRRSSKEPLSETEFLDFLKEMDEDGSSDLA